MKRFLPLLLIWIAPTLALGQPGSFDWALDCGNPPNSTDGKTTVASDQEGNLYMAGEFIESARFGDTLLMSSGGTDIFMVKYDIHGELAWVRSLGGGDYDFVQDISLDGDGNILLAGYFYGTTDLAGDIYSSFGSQDVFAAMFSPQGNRVWTARAGGIMADFVTGIAAGTNGATVLTGHFYNEMTLGDTVIMSSAGSDVYLALLDAAGEFSSVTTLGGSSSDQVRSVDIDSGGNILLTGSYYYDITIGDTTFTTPYPVGVFLAEMGPDLSLSWAVQLNGTYLGNEAYARYDQAGGIFLAGNFSGEVLFGDKPFVAEPFDQDIYVAKFNGNGGYLWARHGQSAASDQVIGLDTDPAGNLYVTGHYLDTIRFDELVLPYTLCCGSREIFVASFGENGNELWGQQVSGTRAAVQAMTVSSAGKIFLSGLYTEEVTFGPFLLSNFSGFLNYYTCLGADAATGVRTMPGNDGLALWPNPAGESLSFLTKDGMELSDLMVTDLSGRVLLLIPSHRDGPVDVSGLPPGAYVVSAKDLRTGQPIKKIFIRR